MAEWKLFDPDAPPLWLDPESLRDDPAYSHIDSPTGAHVARLHATARTAMDAAKMARTYRIVDLGAGDGALLQLLDMPYRSQSWGYDIVRKNCRYAKDVRGVQVLLNNMVRGVSHGIIDLAPVAVITEVLEHMPDPHAFLDSLRINYPTTTVVASSPAHETFERHEPNHAWAWDAQGYAAMFEAAGYTPVSFERVDWSQLWTFGPAL